MLLNVPIQLITSTPTLGKLGILTVSIYLQTIKKTMAEITYCAGIILMLWVNSLSTGEEAITPLFHDCRTTYTSWNHYIMKRY